MHVFLCKLINQVQWRFHVNMLVLKAWLGPESMHKKVLIILMLNYFLYAFKIESLASLFYFP
jgi:hypothetical protein